MAWRAAKSLLTWHSQLKAMAPRTVKELPGGVWGLVGDLNHTSTSDHSPHDFPGWGSDIVTAGDAPDDPGKGLDGRTVAERMRLSRDPRIKYVISHGQMFSSYPSGGIPAWTWRKYTGSDGHYTHIHLSVVGDARADGMQAWAVGPSTVGASDVNLSDPVRIIAFGPPQTLAELNKAETITVETALGAGVRRAAEAARGTLDILARLAAMDITVRAMAETIAHMAAGGTSIDTQAIITRMEALAADEVAREEARREALAEAYAPEAP